MTEEKKGRRPPEKPKEGKPKEGAKHKTMAPVILPAQDHEPRTLGKIENRL